MTGLPTLQVLLDNGTGTFPHDITSKCLLGPGYSFTRGRDDWQGGVSSSSISLTLNNSDGRFTPGSTIIATPTPIKVDQRIRIKETINGITFNRFTGYVKSWPVAWPAVVPTFSTVQITVTDAQARAERHELRSVTQEEILADSPVAYYTLGEPTGAVAAADTSGNQASALTMTGSGTAVVFGTADGPTTDGLTAATFAGGKYLSGLLPLSTATRMVLGCAFSRASTPGSAETVAAINAGAMELVIETSGKLSLYELGTLMAQTAASVCDGGVHYALASYTTGGGDLTLDGVSAGSTVAAQPSTLTSYLLTVGGGGDSHGPANFTGVISHVAAWGTAGTPDSAAFWSAISTGFAGESGTARLTRLAGYAGLPVGTLDTSLTNMAFVDTTGKSAWEAIQQVADAEGGVVFIDGSGNLIFHNRNRSPVKTTPDITLTALAITPDVQPVTDDQQIINYLEATSEATTVTQVVQNAASISSHGKYPTSVSYLVQTDAEALDRANWLVANFAEPTTRYGTLTINLYGMTASLAQSVLSAIEINCWLRITGAPSQTPGSTTIDVVVEGYTEELTADSWTLTLNVVSRSLFTALILDNATLGVLDSNRLYF